MNKKIFQSQTIRSTKIMSSNNICAGNYNSVSSPCNEHNFGTEINVSEADSCDARRTMLNLLCVDRDKDQPTLAESVVAEHGVNSQKESELAPTTVKSERYLEDPDFKCKLLLKEPEVKKGLTKTILKTWQLKLHSKMQPTNVKQEPEVRYKLEIPFAEDKCEANAKDRDIKVEPFPIEELYIKEELLESTLTANNSCSNEEHEQSYTRKYHVQQQTVTSKNCPSQSDGADNGQALSSQVGKSVRNTSGKFKAQQCTESSDQSIIKKGLEKFFKCKMCKYKTVRSIAFEKHMRMHTAKWLLDCKTCGYKTTRNATFKQHIKTHSADKPFACTVCEFKTAYRLYLKLHMRQHTGEKPYKCDLCNYTTARSHCLQLHMKWHSGEKPFKCDLCVYKASRHSHLKLHMRTHTGEKPFICTVCDYKTANKSWLNVHIRTHTGEKPFECKICGYRTAENSSLKTHLRKHTGEKPFACNICDFKTAQRSNLKMHIKRQHTGERPFIRKM